MTAFLFRFVLIPRTKYCGLGLFCLIFFHDIISPYVYFLLLDFVRLVVGVLGSEGRERK